MTQVPQFCQKQFPKGDTCRSHYASVRDGDTGKLVQCPYGFSSMKLGLDDDQVAFTCMVPFPRLGGSKERKRAKDFPNVKVSTVAVERAKAVLQEVAARMTEWKKLQTRGLEEKEAQIVQRYAMALHEIRKLNRDVKQKAERLCMAQSPGNPTDASNIWKAADLMSAQFDIIDVLANEHYLTLELNIRSDPFRLIDKIKRLKEKPSHRIRIDHPEGYNPSIWVCDKTFPIIPHVLIDNAIRYGLKGYQITVNIKPAGHDHCAIEVSNVARADKVLDDSIFKKGVRASSDGEGSGFGLYVAQRVAEQHNTVISVHNGPQKNGTRTYTFRVVFPTLKRR